jgi:hypothetical protein
MPRKVLTTDRKPGKLPKIHSVRDSITYVMAIDDIDAQLTLRCDFQGNVFVSATPAVRSQR